MLCVCLITCTCLLFSSRMLVYMRGYAFLMSTGSGKTAPTRHNPRVRANAQGKLFPFDKILRFCSVPSAWILLGTVWMVLIKQVVFSLIREKPFGSFIHPQEASHSRRKAGRFFRSAVPAFLFVLLTHGWVYLLFHSVVFNHFFISFSFCGHCDWVPNMANHTGTCGRPLTPILPLLHTI